MREQSVHLSVDIGAANTVAVVEFGGRPLPVVADRKVNRASRSSAAETADNAKMMAIGTDPDREAVVSALAAVLTSVSVQAQRAAPAAETLTLTAPPQWGPRRQQFLRDAAERAGLPIPNVVAEHIAAAAYAAHLQPVAEGKCVLVCDIGAASTEVSIVQRAAERWVSLATIPAPAATAHAVEQHVADHLAVHGVSRPEASALAPDALVQVVERGSALIVHSGTPDTVVIGPAQAKMLCAAARADLGVAISEAIDAADITTDQLALALCLGGISRLVDAPVLVEQRTGIVPLDVDEPELVVARGALLVNRPSGSDPDATMAKTVLRGVRLRHVAAVLPTSLAGMALAIQQVNILQDALPRPGSPRQWDFGELSARYSGAHLATAGLLMTLGSLAAGQFLAASYEHEAAVTGTSRYRRRAGRLLAFCAVIGLVTAGIFGLLAQAVLGGPADDAPTYLFDSVKAAAVPALLCIAIGLIAPLVPQERVTAWPHLLRFPLTAGLLAAAGIWCMWESANGMRTFTAVIDSPVLTWLAANGGAALVGIATAWPLLTGKLARAVLAGTLAIGYTAIYTWSLAPVITTIFVITVVVWWIRQSTVLLGRSLPTGVRERIVRYLQP